MAAQRQPKIDVSCNSCGKRFSAPQKAAGHKIACPNCKSPMVVGQARRERSPNPESASPHKTRILCAFCNETLIILPKMLDDAMVCSKCGGDIDYTAYEPLVKILEEREEAKRAGRERVRAVKAAQREKAKHERAAKRERERDERNERKALAEQEKRRDLVETNASPAAMQSQAEGPSPGHRKLALIACPECKKKISDTAGNCPNCGYQLTPEKVAELKKQQQVANGCAIGCLSIIAIFVLFVIVVYSSSDSSSSSTSSSHDVVENSAWDGSVAQVKSWLEANLKDPDSIEFIDWYEVQKISDGGFSVRVKYRAKNSFGGYVVENKVFLLNSAGIVTNW